MLTKWEKAKSIIQRMNQFIISWEISCVGGINVTYFIYYDNNGEPIQKSPIYGAKLTWWWQLSLYQNEPTILDDPYIVSRQSFIE